VITSEQISNKDIKKVFFFRVCGTGMGAVACLMREKGFHVEGGDYNFYPPMSDYLKETGIPLIDLNEDMGDKLREKLKSFDLIVVGNVVPKASDDAKLIEGLGVDYCSFPAALGGLVLKETHVVGISGTHGKTTTTYYLTQMLEHLGEKPGYLIGGVVEGRPSASLGDGKSFIIESDEYDSAYFEKISKFRSYCIDDLVLTSLEFDHADIFNSIEDIKDQFSFMLEELPGEVFYNDTYQATNELKEKHARLKWNPYSFNNNIEILEKSELGTTFQIKIKEDIYKVKTNLIGEHNILNVVSCIMYCLSKGHPMSMVASSVKNLKHVKRRQEERGYYNKALVIDDFAHHPRSVALTIDGIKTKYAGKKVTVVLEPNSATARSNIFQKEFADALSLADSVIMAKASRDTSVKNTKNLDYEKIVNQLNHLGKKAFYATELKKLRAYIDDCIDEGDVLLILSNGTCLGLWQSDFVDNLL